MQLTYKAVTKEGKLYQGLIDARDIKDAGTILRQRGLIPIGIKIQKKSSTSTFLSFFRKAGSSEVIFFTRQLASMLSTGLTLLQALHILKDQIQNNAMKTIVTQIVSDIEEGKTFSYAIEKTPEVFSPLYIAFIKAAESAGLLDKVLLRLAENLEKQQKLKTTIKSALMYPALVVVMMLAALVVMMIFVIPQISALYVSLNLTLPITTQIVIGISNFLLNFWPLIAGAIVLLVVSYNRWYATDSGRLVIDDLRLKIPIFGKLHEQTVLAEMTRTLGLLIGTGSLVMDSLQQSGEVAGNSLYKNAINEVSKRVQKGISIGDAMQGNALFPPLLVQMVKIGEQTGKLDESLMNASSYFEGEVDQTVKTLTTAMEPFIIISLGLGVGFLIISIITPIYSLISSL